MKLVTQEQSEQILLILLTLLAGTPAKAFIKALQRPMLDHFIWHIMRGMGALKRKPIEKNNG